jgi:hypothetical protein
MASSGSTGSGSTGSGSTGSGSTGSGSTGSGSTGSGSTTGGSDIGSLNSGLKQLQKSGPADLKLSSAAQTDYLNIIDAFHTALNNELTTIKNLGGLGSPGSLASANETKNNLELDITGLEGIQQSINQYLSYLEQFSATVKAAGNRLIGSG